MMEGTIRGRGKNKRFWTPQEDDTLLHALLELSRNPKWKSENGFKPGYMNLLEEMILAKLPDCGLKAEPHIDSRLKHWSEKYSAMAEMLGTSGFGWDAERNLVQVERSVYEEWCKTHKKAKGLYGVPFPFYDMLVEIYGKDRATGEGSESYARAVQNIDIEMSESITLDSDDDFDAETESGASVASGSRKRKTSAAKKQKGSKKRKDEVGDLASSLEAVSTSFANVFQEMNSSLVAIAQVWTNEDERKKRLESENSGILDELLKLDVLSPSDALEVATVLIGEENKLRVFMQANTSMKKQYVTDLLKRRN